MGTFSIWHWMIVLVVLLLLFGRGKIPALMGDMAKGIKAFKSGMKEDEDAETPPKAIDQDTKDTKDTKDTQGTATTAADATVKKDEAAQG